MYSLFFYFQGLNKFYDNLIQAILRHVNFEVVKCVIIASPGPYKDQFHSYMIQQAVKTDNKVITDNKSKFLLVHATSGFKHSLKGKISLKFFQFYVMNHHKIAFT